MTYEHKVIGSAAKSRSAFESIQASLDPTELGIIYAPLWAEITAYYERDVKALSVDTSIVTGRVAASVAGDKKQGALRSLCEEVWATEVSPVNVAEYVRDLALSAAGMRLGMAVAARRGKGEVEPLARAYTALLDAPAAQDQEDEEMSFSQALRARIDPANRIKISPPCLGDRLGGGVFPGNVIWIFGRPNSGKTGLGLTIAAGFARRGLRGLWLTNEDPALTGMVRLACCLTGITEADMTADPSAAEMSAIAKGITRVGFRDLSPGTPSEIERIIQVARPAFIVVDQVRNLSMKGTDGNTNRVDAAGQFVRAMAKRYGLVGIGMAQADASSSGKLVLSQEDMDSSKTGLPGSGDVIIGVGVNEQMEAAGQRMISICKNKLTSRHEHWPINFNPFLSRYTTIK